MLALVGAFTWLGLRALGCRGRKALLRVATVVGPFSAPFASEQLLRQALEGSSAPARAATLVGDKDFLDWIRPWAYDDRVGHDRGASAQEEAMSELLASLPAEVRDRAIGAIPSDGSAPAARFCPRCGGAYLETALACDACDGIQLLNTSERRVNERY
jgi:hypothetical protein